MRPLKITAACSEPIAGDVPRLDALLEWCMSRHVGRDLGLSHADGERTDYTPGLIPSPIARRTVEGCPWPIPLCSDPIYRAQADYADHFARRTEVNDPGLLRDDARKVFHSTMGEFKSYRLPLRARLVPYIVWFAVADTKSKGWKTNRDGERVRHIGSTASEIRNLLAGVRALGKKTAIGYGGGVTWAVEDWRDDWSWFAPSPAGPVLMRHLPACVPLPEGCVGYRPWFGGVAPPYWSRAHFVEAVQPC